MINSKNRVFSITCKGDKKNLLVFLSIVVAIVATIVNLLDQLYVDIDNWTLSTVVNGLYSNDNYCLYLNPVLCYLLKAMSFVMPNADVFLLLIRVATFGIYYSFAYTIFNSGNKAMDWLLFGVFVICCLPQMNYTAQTCIFGGSGMLLYTIQNKESKYIRYYGLVLIVISALMRKEAFFLFIPYAGITYLYSFFEDRKSINWKEQIIVCLLCFGLIGYKYYYDNNYYIEYVEYNRARTEFVDYKRFEYDSLISDIPSLKEYDYKLLSAGYLADPDYFTTEYLRAVRQAGTSNQSIRREISEIIANMVNTIGNSLKIQVYIVVILFFSILVMLQSNKKTRIPVLVGVIGSIIIICGLEYLGRCPAYVYQAVFLSCIFCVLSLYYRYRSSRYNRPLLGKIVLSTFNVSLMVFISLGIFRLAIQDVHELQCELNARVKNETINMFDNNLEAVYIWEPHAYTVDCCYNGFMKKGKLPNDHFMKHNISGGNWLYGQRYWISFLTNIDLANPTKCLLTREDVLYVGTLSSMLEKHLSSTYGNVSSIVIDTSNGRDIWKFMLID